MAEKKTIIVEFNGLPGLGKTTVANLVVKKLIEKGYIAVSHYRKNVLNNFHHPFPELFSLSLYFRMVSFARNLPPKGKKRTHVHIVNFYAHKYDQIRRYCKADFAIIDEAIIQFWVAIAFNDVIPRDNYEKVKSIVRKLKAMNIDFIRVDCLNHVDSAAARIKQRPQKNIIFEKLGDADLLSALKAEAANFEYLRAVFSEMYENQPVITIDTNDDPEVNANRISDFLINIVNTNNR